MTKTDKLFDKVRERPTVLKYAEVEKLLLNLGFQKIEAKGSHKKFKHPLLEDDIVIPVHHNQCKDFYKKQVAKILKQRGFI